jgi:hypothetical protein
LPAAKSRRRGACATGGILIGGLACRLASLPVLADHPIQLAIAAAE